eukprot:9461504-Pyramimonas_sp.AAC.1
MPVGGRASQNIASDRKARVTKRACTAHVYAQTRRRMPLSGSVIVESAGIVDLRLRETGALPEGRAVLLIDPNTLPRASGPSLDWPRRA